MNLSYGWVEGHFDIFGQEKIERQFERCEGCAAADLIDGDIVKLCFAIGAAAFILKDQQ